MASTSSSTTGGGLIGHAAMVATLPLLDPSSARRDPHGSARASGRRRRVGERRLQSAPAAGCALARRVGLLRSVVIVKRVRSTLAASVTTLGRWREGPT